MKHARSPEKLLSLIFRDFRGDPPGPPKNPVFGGVRGPPKKGPKFWRAPPLFLFSARNFPGAVIQSLIRRQNPGFGGVQDPPGMFSCSSALESSYCCCCRLLESSTMRRKMNPDALLDLMVLLIDLELSCKGNLY